MEEVDLEVMLDLVGQVEEEVLLQKRSDTVHAGFVV